MDKPARRRPVLPAVLSLVLVSGGAWAAAPTWRSEPPGAGARAPERSAALRAMLDEYVDWLMRESPLWATTRGDERFNDKLEDASPAASERRNAEMAAFLERLRALDRAGFTDEDHLDADLLVYELELGVARAALRLEQMPINSQEGPHIWLPQFGDQVPLRTSKHWSDYAARLEAVPTLIDQQIEQMRLGLAAGRTPPRVVLARSVAGVRSLCSPEIVADPVKSPFYRPFLKPGADQSQAARARAAIAQGITPAYERLARFLEDEYIPRCRETVGISQSVDGPAAYEIQLRHYTTTTLSAQQIHDIGLAEVARIKAEMLACIGETDWAGRDASGSDDERLRAFIAFLRTDPRFYYTDTREMLRDYREICKNMDSQLPRLFGRMPRNQYGVREIPKFAAATAAAAYYNPGSLRAGIAGWFMVNTAQPDQRPKYGMVSLALHEAVPGHHMQIAIADELDGVHEFRTLTGYTAYVEGWALYSERLGLEVGSEFAREGGNPERGMYADPYDNFGRLSDEMWRACRLVVDTGLHALGWTRRQALDYMLAHTAGTEADLTNEIDRYIGWPGQACAYKIGELKIRELRARGERELGERFDLRSFHDEVLGGGALPLPVLEKRIERWMEGRKAGG